MANETIASLVARAARRDPAAGAILAPGGETLSYGELAEEIARVARALRARGVARGDRAAWIAAGGPQAAVAFLGSAAACASAPINPALGPRELRAQLEDLRPRIVLLAGEQHSAGAAARALGIEVMELRARPDGRPGFALPEGRSEVEEAGPEDVALVLHTSGTTARPKQVPLGHRSLCVAARNVASTLRLSDADRALNMMPLFHIHGLVAGLLASLSAGSSVVCAPGFDPRGVREWVARLRPTWYSAVPAIHMAMRDAFEGTPPDGGFPFRFARSSSSALPPAVIGALETLYGAPVLEAYGMTEAAHQIASNPLPPAQRKPGSVGLPAGPEVAIRDPQGRDASTGVEGEVWIRGETVVRGYHDNPDANAESYANGWFRTGDLGRLDADGYLWLTGRLKELVNRGGEKIAPAEVDNVLLEHPDVAQAACCAMPHPTLGEEVAAVVVLRPGAVDVTVRDLLAHCASRLAPFKRPKQILIVPEIPRSATGKVQRRGLWEAVAPPRA